MDKNVGYSAFGYKGYMDKEYTWSNIDELAQDHHKISGGVENFEQLKRYVNSWGDGKYKAGDRIKSPHEPYDEYVLGVYRITKDEFLSLDPYEILTCGFGTFYEDPIDAELTAFILVARDGGQVLQTERRDCYDLQTAFA